ncbi:molecular chaperone [Entomohabitans teleogrylli]|uniref:fimbrial biogenesis chaperone n=1 Tax=Entomohabitans teleogrylli TaxID=1384589 RepID=UPI00073D4C2F|nr:fimbria/pilus periplasmic chaperone [Entomohabitans teleogrylli]
MNLNFIYFSGLFLCSLSVHSAFAALSVERSRVIFNEGEKSVGLTVKNSNLQDPYLAQGWMENEKEEKISGPLMILPPVQRVEAGGKTMIRIQQVTDISALPKDRESVFWLNLREIPPKSDRPNVLMLAMQTRMKVFWRPKSLKVDPLADTVPGTDTLTLTRQGDRYQVNNPTAWHFSFVEMRSSLHGKGLDNFEPVMVSPKGKAELPLPASRAGNNPVLVFINDYGSARLLPFTCTGNTCKAGKVALPREG